MMKWPSIIAWNIKHHRLEHLLQCRHPDQDLIPIKMVESEEMCWAMMLGYSTIKME